ncbi:phage protein [Klebsiella quasipneumoniae]|nr:phage protein [Klebsiella quasipneumoniae]
MNIGTAMKFWGGGRGSIESFVAGFNFCRAAIIRAQSAPEREQIRHEHAEWSQSTFGNFGPVGPLKHLSKEALEAAEQPGDLSEWADMQFLLWDAQRRAGITDDQITQAMIDKLAVNKQREWPEPKDGEPRLHIKSQPATQEVHDEK